jgi:hypothetical protein
MEVEKRLPWVNKAHSKLSISRQCQLLKLNRSRVYYRSKSRQMEREKLLLDAIDQIMKESPFLGSRKVTHLLQEQKKFGLSPACAKAFSAILDFFICCPFCFQKATSKGIVVLRKEPVPNHEASGE